MSSELQVSVLIPAYNEEQFIADCVESVDEQQIESSLEIVVCDDCSTDSTSEILERQLDQIDQLRVISNESNQGVITTSNKLLAEARGTYFVRIDADSVMKPGTLAAILDELEAGHPLFFGRVDVQNTTYLHPTAAKVGKLRGRSTWYGGACIAGHIDRFVKSGGFDDEMVGAEAQELKQRSKTLDWSVGYLNDCGVNSNFPTGLWPVLYRKFDSARSHIRQYKNTPEQFSLWEIRGPVFWTVFISISLVSLIFPLLWTAALGTLLMPLHQYGRDAPLAVSISNRRSFFLLYPLYEAGSGVARTVGVWTSIGTLLEIILQKYLR